MENLIYGRGLAFMAMLMLTLVVIIAWSIYYIIQVKRNPSTDFRDKLSMIKSVGLFALVLGFLDQLIGWYTIMTAIEEAGDITMNIVLNALKASMIPLLFGGCIFICSYLIWFLFSFLIRKAV